MSKLSRKNLKKHLSAWLCKKELLYGGLDALGFKINPVPNKEYAFLDQDSDVLLVAHCDTVLPPGLKGKNKNKKRIYGQGLDDRLGCMMAYHLSQDLKCDVLICDHEEIGKSTAQFFDGDLRKYNLVLELDRAGTDVVTYELDSEPWIKLLEKYWDVGMGAFSDICFLDPTLDTCMANIGVGYHLAHSPDSYCVIDETLSQYALTHQFILDNRKNKHIQEDWGVYKDDHNWGYQDEDWEMYLPFNCNVCNHEMDAYTYLHDNCEICGHYVGHTIDRLWDEELDGDHEDLFIKPIKKVDNLK